MLVVVLLPEVGVLKLVEPGGRGQFGIEEAKHAQVRSRRCITVPKLVELGRELRVIIDMLLAMVLPFNSIGDPHVALVA